MAARAREGLREVRWRLAAATIYSEVSSATESSADHRAAHSVEWVEMTSARLPQSGAVVQNIGFHGRAVGRLKALVFRLEGN